MDPKRLPEFIKLKNNKNQNNKQEKLLLTDIMHDYKELNLIKSSQKLNTEGTGGAQFQKKEAILNKVLGESQKQELKKNSLVYNSEEVKQVVESKIKVLKPRSVSVKKNLEVSNFNSNVVSSNNTTNNKLNNYNNNLNNSSNLNNIHKNKNDKSNKQHVSNLNSNKENNLNSNKIKIKNPASVSNPNNINNNMVTTRLEKNSKNLNNLNNINDLNNLNNLNKLNYFYYFCNN